MSLDLTEGCTHPSGRHLYNCHQVCQWCNWDKADIELIKLRDRVRELERFENIINETGRKFWPAIGTPECRNAIHDPEKRGVFDVLVFLNKLLNENSKGQTQGVRDGTQG